MSLLLYVQHIFEIDDPKSPVVVQEWGIALLSLVR
jgi:hypothetical protein